MLHLIQTAIVVFGLIAVLFRIRCDVRAALPMILRVVRDYEDALAQGTGEIMRGGFATFSVVVPAMPEALDLDPAERVLLAA